MDTKPASSFRCKPCGSVAYSTECLRCKLGNITLVAGFALSPASKLVAGVETFRAFACASNTSCPETKVLSQRQKSVSGNKLTLKAGAGSGCPKGSRSPLCGVCANDYTGGANTPCVACGNESSAFSKLVSSCALCCQCAVGESREGRARRHKDVQGGPRKAALGGAKKFKEVQGIIRIVVGNYQVISMMPSVFKIDYPAGFTAVIDVLRVLSLDILKVFYVDCWSSITYFNKCFFAMLTPINKKNNQTTGVMLGSIALVLFLLYPSISAKTFEMFECRALGDGASVHKLDYSVYCRDNDEITVTYAGYVSIATLMIFAYPIGSRPSLRCSRSPRRSTCRSRSTTRAQSCAAAAASGNLSMAKTSCCWRR